MHVRNFCLCVDCVRADTENDDEIRLRARALIASLEPKTAHVTPIGQGLIRRTKRAA